MKMTREQRVAEIALDYALALSDAVGEKLR